jgi:hypothetical protein
VEGIRATYAVPEPVGRDGETDTAGSNREREGLRDDDPHADTADLLVSAPLSWPMVTPMMPTRY